MCCSSCRNISALLPKRLGRYCYQLSNIAKALWGLARPTKSAMVHQRHIHSCSLFHNVQAVSVVGYVHMIHTSPSAVLLLPRALWLRLCGGLTAQDLLVVCMWAAINLSWFTAAFAYYQHKTALKAAANGLASATGQQAMNAAARSFGATLAPNLVLLFYPVSRGSVVLQMTGLSYPAGIR